MTIGARRVAERLLEVSEQTIKAMAELESAGELTQKELREGKKSTKGVLLEALGGETLTLNGIPTTPDALGKCGWIYTYREVQDIQKVK